MRIPVVDARGWTDEYECVSPPCPWCGEEITDSPNEDLELNGFIEVECAYCRRPVEVFGESIARFKARRA